MTPTWRCWCWKLAMGGAIAFFGDYALAQITPDGTLGAESSVVTPINNSGLLTKQIDGGAIRGTNLFHSFEQFSVSTGSAAYFNNSQNIQNIISRVTGKSVSNIDGLIRANGTANLFLLNPNGIIFGSSASLNIGGSFIGSTASSVNFADGTLFSANAPQTTPLLTVSVPLGLQYSGTAGIIKNQSQATISDGYIVGLQVQPGKTLGLLGGDVAIEGGTLTAAGGRIELGSVTGTGLVSLELIDEGWALGYEGVQDFGNIQLSQFASVDVSGSGGGNIQVQSRRVTLTDGSQILAMSVGVEPGGTLSVTGTDAVEVIGMSTDGQFSSGLFVETEGTGDAGDLRITTGRLLVRDGASVTTSTFGSGSAGTLVVSARESVEVIGTTADGQAPSGLFTSANLTATGVSTGSGGDLTIETGRLIVRDGAQLAASTFGSGSAGSLTVTASDLVEVIGTTADGSYSSGLFTSVQEGATGSGGNLTVETGQLIVQDGAQIQAATLGSGSAGTLIVRARDSVEVVGTSADGLTPSGLFTEVNRGATGDSSNLNIDTRQLIVRDGAAVSAATFGSGVAGNLVIWARDSVEVIGKSADGQRSSRLTTETRGTGDARDLTIETGQLTVRDGAEVTASSTGSGIAGNLQVQARDLLLDNRGAITATTKLGNGGDVTLQAQDLLLMRRESNISTRAGTEQTNGSGGNITIDTKNLVALENSDIDANAFGGPGGQVRINASGIFGIKGREQQTPDSDITASSNLGPQFSGTVEINTPDVDPGQGLVNLPTELVDITGLIAQGCPASGGQGQSEFIITGRGGLPIHPGDADLSPYPTGTVRSIPSTGSSSETARSSVSGSVPSTNSTSAAPTQIVEAQGWMINNKGEVVLTASAPTVIPHIPWTTPAECHGSSTFHKQPGGVPDQLFSS